MEYLQYIDVPEVTGTGFASFKPCYKWNTFNTGNKTLDNGTGYLVLNLVISGIPSILFQVQLILAN